MRKLFKCLIILLMTQLLFACGLFSSDDDVAPTPRPLTDIIETTQLTKVWSKRIGKGVGKSYEMLEPVVFDEVVFVSDVEGTVLALNRENGKEIWKHRLKDTLVGGGVGVGAGMVFLGTLDGRVVALNQEDGRELWQAQVSSEILSIPVTDGAYVVVQTIDDSITVLNAQTGNVHWRQESFQPKLTLRGSSQPVVYHEAVFSGFVSGEAKAFRLTNGELLWSSRVSVPEGSSELERMVDIKGSPLITEGSVYFGSFQGNTVNLDMYSGQVRWSKPISTSKSMAEGSGSLYLINGNSFVSSLDLRTGASNWRLELFEFRDLTAPSIFNNFVVVGDMAGYIHLISQLDGNVSGRFKIGSSAIKAQPVVDGELLFVMTSDGELVALKEKISL